MTLNFSNFVFSVAECKQVKMPPSNIAKIFGPTLVGYSSSDPDQNAIFTETIIQAGVSMIHCYSFYVIKSLDLI